MAPRSTKYTRGGRPEHANLTSTKRDDWMLAPDALDVDYVQRKKRRSPPSKWVKAAEKAHTLDQTATELQLQNKDINTSDESNDVTDQPTQHEVGYTIGDAGSAWRMTKLRGTYSKAEESGRKIEDIALQQYGSLRAFDDAREEEIEMDRRKMYGEDYVGKDKPNGDLFQERKLDIGIRRDNNSTAEESDDKFAQAQGQVMQEAPPPAKTMVLDQTALNKLKAQILKAKMMKAPNAADLETQYSAAMSNAATNKQPDVLVLNKMEGRMLAGGRKGEVTGVDNKRGRERGTVVENEDMSIEDMVRQERRTRGQFGGDGRAFAERIAKDAKFDVRTCEPVAEIFRD